MMNCKACAFCDMAKHGLSAEEAFAYGWVLGRNVDPCKTMGEATMCSKHRMAALMAATSVAVKVA